MLKFNNKDKFLLFIYLIDLLTSVLPIILLLMQSDIKRHTRDFDSI